MGGTGAHRVDGRRLLLITQSSSVVTSVVLGALVVSGQVAFWHIYVINAVNATIAAFDSPARQSLFPTLVPRGQRQNAITLNSMLFRSSNLVGRAVAGFLIPQFGGALPSFGNRVNLLSFSVA